MLAAALFAGAACSSGAPEPGQIARSPASSGSTSARPTSGAVGFTYTVAPVVGGPGKSRTATLTNTSAVPLGTGNPFTIARRSAGGWRRIPPPERCVFTMELRILQPGESHAQQVGRLTDDCGYRELRPGMYRVMKRVEVIEAESVDQDVLWAKATFRVTR